LITSSVRSYGRAPRQPDSCIVIHCENTGESTGTTVRCACPTCGLVDIGVDDVTILIGALGSGLRYAYDCPDCCERIEIAPNPAVLNVLADIGAAVAMSSVSALSATPSRRIHVLDEQVRQFQIMLDRTDDIAGAAEGTHEAAPENAV
jgi:hypothetical protein